MGFFFPDGPGPTTPVYNEDGSVFGYIDDEVRPEDEYGNEIRGNYAKRSIWDDDEEDNPAEGYAYHRPPKVPLNNPTGFWGAGGGGNSWWGAPSPGQRWGDDPAGGLDPSTGQPKSTGGSVRYTGIGPDAERKIKELRRRYSDIRHPSRKIKAHIKAELTKHIPRAQVKKVMKDQNWL